jgi:HK97 gp10 family phage protein
MDEKIEGLGQLHAAFSSLGKDMEVRASRRMVVAGGGALKKEAKRLALSFGLKRTGALINNIAIKREKTPAGITQYNLGERHGRDLTKKGAKKLRLKVGKSGRVVYANDPFYWRFQEFTRKGRKGTPFIGASLDNKRQEAIDAMEMSLADVIEKANAL